ncbi:hypothetical protein WJX74_001168 [Apatococcus lobatus]|uniref:GATA-type domain-containing protein n=1 Tax=Apatococcus lobatus TaxID=904363 RepID=A0AAW1QYB6_9CHLO
MAITEQDAISTRYSSKRSRAYNAALITGSFTLLSFTRLLQFMKRPRSHEDSDHSDSTDIQGPSVADLYVMGLYTSGQSIKQPDCTAALTLINLSLSRPGPSAAELHDWFEDLNQGASLEQEAAASEAEDDDTEACGSTDTPLWRTGPLGPKTLCNACGVKFSRHQQKGKPGVKHHVTKKVKLANSHSPPNSGSPLA